MKIEFDYSDETKKMINDAYTDVVSDLINIFKDNNCKEVKMYVFLLGKSKLFGLSKLILNKDDMVIKDVFGEKYEFLKNGVILYSSTKDNFDSDIRLINKYPKIKKRIIKKINHINHGKLKELNKINLVKEKISEDSEKNSVVFTLNLPPSKLQNNFEVSSDGNKTIGYIKFGEGSFKVETDCDLVVDNDENIKVKIKK